MDVVCHHKISIYPTYYPSCWLWMGEWVVHWINVRRQRNLDWWQNWRRYCRIVSITMSFKFWLWNPLNNRRSYYFTIHIELENGYRKTIFDTQLLFFRRLFMCDYAERNNLFTIYTLSGNSFLTYFEIFRRSLGPPCLIWFIACRWGKSTEQKIEEQNRNDYTIIW